MTIWNRLVPPLEIDWKSASPLPDALTAPLAVRLPVPNEPGPSRLSPLQATAARDSNANVASVSAACRTLEERAPRARVVRVGCSSCMGPLVRDRRFSSPDFSGLRGTCWMVTSLNDPLSRSRRAAATGRARFQQDQTRFPQGRTKESTPRPQESHSPPTGLVVTSLPRLSATPDQRRRR